LKGLDAPERRLRHFQIKKSSKFSCGVGILPALNLGRARMPIPQDGEFNFWKSLIGIDIKTVEYGFPVGMPTCRPMGDGLYEVRTNLPQGRKARVLFCIHEGNMVLLHGFIKKTQKTPKKELNLAQERKQQVEAG
jgi:phage-related protein